MGRTRRSTTSYFRRAPYNLRSRSRVPNYLNTIGSEDSSATEVKDLPKLESVDLQDAENSTAHHTNMYDEHVVFRRAQSFKIKMTLTKSLSEDQSGSMIFSTGRTPYPSKGTLLMFDLVDSSSKYGWDCTSTTQDRQTFLFEITASPEAIIGRYSISIKIADATTSKTTKSKQEFILIFNPWAVNDDVYMSEATWRDEYVLNESGRIWVGSKNSYYGKPWIFGQFEKESLSTALYVLEISDLSDGALSNPAIISRTFSKMSNSFDDDGVLAGNWSGDYSGGTEPTDWISSVPILKEYLDTQKEVKYGQCWVFSGILTTLHRAVGIPVRSVTNFESAHDNDGSMTIDRHWDVNDKPLTDLNDSIWNFHVWNEVWMKRQDLPSGHDGWQAVDGTPQERSEGVMQCGPASIKAIKEGEVYLPHDCKFIFAEVNGDIVEWVKNTKGEMEPVWKEKSSIGFNISTKAVGSSDREDITSHYKHTEGTEKERETVSTVARYSSRRDQLIDFYKLSQENSVAFNLSGTGYKTGDVEIRLTMDSNDMKALDIDVMLTCVACYYNGLSSDELLVTRESVQLASKGTQEIVVALQGKDYLNKISTDAVVSVFCKSLVKQTGQRFFIKESFTIDRPEVMIEAPSEVEQGSPFTVKVSFLNELSIPMTGCKLQLEGPGITSSKTVRLMSSTIEAGSSLHQTITLVARSSGIKEIVAQLHTRQLQNVTGSAIITVLPE